MYKCEVACITHHFLLVVTLNRNGIFSVTNQLDMEPRDDVINLYQYLIFTQLWFQRCMVRNT